MSLAHPLGLDRLDPAPVRTAQVQGRPCQATRQVPAREWNSYSAQARLIITTTHRRAGLEVTINLYIMSELTAFYFHPTSYFQACVPTGARGMCAPESVWTRQFQVLSGFGMN